MPLDSALYNVSSGPTMERGEGVYVYDVDHMGYLDAGAGTFNLSLGYSHPAVVAAVVEQAGRLIHVTQRFRAEPVEELARRLVEVSPESLTRVHLKSSSGSTAVEGAVKMAQQATGKRDVITLFRSHHGQTMFGAAISGNAFRRTKLPLLSPGALQVPDPYCRRCFYRQRRSTCDLLCADRVADFIEFASSGSVAAFLVEPISGSGGNVVLPDGYLERIRRICDDHGMVLILDEVQTGIGRTGRMFAAEHFGVRAEAIVTGKGLGGSGAQVAAILTESSLLGLEQSDHTFTFGGNVLAAAAANETLRIISAPGFLEHVRVVGDYLKARLGDLATRHPFMEEVRGLGLMLGFEIVTPDGEPDVARTNAIAETALHHGLLLRTSRYGRGNVVKIRPPLIITTIEADVLIERLDATLVDVAAC